MKRFILSLSLALPLVAMADIVPLKISPIDSYIHFAATQNSEPVLGEFKSFKGEIGFDTEKLEDSTVHMLIDIGSISCSQSETTSTLLTSDWFNAKLFPQAEFVTTGFKKTGDKSYEIQGKLTIRDKTVPTTLKFTGDLSKTKVAVEGSATLSRTAFGVGQNEWSSSKEVGDIVTVNFKINSGS